MRRRGRRRRDGFRSFILSFPPSTGVPPVASGIKQFCELPPCKIQAHQLIIIYFLGKLPVPCFLGPSPLLPVPQLPVPCPILATQPASVPAEWFGTFWRQHSLLVSRLNGSVQSNDNTACYWCCKVKCSKGKETKPLAIFHHFTHTLIQLHIRLPTLWAFEAKSCLPNSIFRPQRFQVRNVVVKKIRYWTKKTLGNRSEPSS